MVLASHAGKCPTKRSRPRITFANVVAFLALILRTGSSRTHIISATRSTTRSWPTSSKLETTVNDTIKWLDVSQEGLKEEYEEKQKKLETITNPIMQTLRPWRYAPGSWVLASRAVLLPAFLALQRTVLA
jgi:hypothetical protein